MELVFCIGRLKSGKQPLLPPHTSPTARTPKFPLEDQESSRIVDIYVSQEKNLGEQGAY